MLLDAAGSTTVMTLTTYLETLGTIVTQVLNWVVQALGVITSNPILLVPFGVIAVFTVIKVLKTIF